MSVLILDGESNAGLAVARSLGRKGIEIDVAGKTGLSPAFFSKYCKNSFVYPNPEKNLKGFVNNLKKIVERKKYEMLIPCTDFTIIPITLHRKFFEKKLLIPLPSNKHLKLAWSKSTTLKIAKSIGIPTPKTFFVKKSSELEKIKNKIKFPVVLKPESSKCIVGNKIVDMQVRYANNFEELKQNFKKMFINGKPPLIQERIKGYGLGFFALLDKGKIKAFFMHRRIREVSVDKGASTLRESIKNKIIKRYGSKLLKKIKWHGVAMVEFRMDEKDKIPKLMEINGRFWNSLPLAIVSGVDFPFLLYKMFKGECLKPILSYKTGVKCRWLTGDAYRLLKIIKSDYNKKVFTEPILKTLKDFFEFFGKDLYYDYFCLDDPLPAFIDILNSFKKILQKGV